MNWLYDEQRSSGRTHGGLTPAVPRFNGGMVCTHDDQLAADLKMQLSTHYWTKHWDTQLNVKLDTSHE